ncbi:MAG: DUF2281 domain-containing protein [Gemmatimonadetes bacterium]|nr:DUF2281 domain-containing protein [Gemmatimonadota bacterium]
MHDVLRQRLMRKIEALPDEQVYQVLDYIEFLESKYAPGVASEPSGIVRFAERLEDRMRRKALSRATIRDALEVIAAADRVLSGVASAGRRVLAELEGGAAGAAQAGRGRGDRAGRGERSDPGASG